MAVVEGSVVVVVGLAEVAMVSLLAAVATEVDSVAALVGSLHTKCQRRGSESQAYIETHVNMCSLASLRSKGREFSKQVLRVQQRQKREIVVGFGVKDREKGMRFLLPMHQSFL